MENGMNLALNLKKTNKIGLGGKKLKKPTRLHTNPVTKAVNHSKSVQPMQHFTTLKMDRLKT